MSETISGMGPKPGSVRIEAFGGQLSTRLDDWLAVEPDGTIRANSGKVELGTGVRTALAQIVAEELDVPFERVHMVMGDTGRTPDEGYTAGSMTILMSGSALRKAAAEARRALLEAAAEALDAGVEELEISAGEVFVTQRPERRASYTALMGGKRFDREVSGTAPLKPPEGYRVVGRPVPRVDIPAKAAGQPSFITDVQVPGMLHARLVRPPGPGAVLESVDESSLAGVPGLVKLVVQGNFIGVIAEREEQAVQAARQLKVSWREPAVLPRMEDLYSLMRAQPAEEKVLVEQGDVQAALGQSSRRIRAAYLQPYHAHASIGPSCAVADARAEGITVWSSTSGPHP
ncbi:MAG TPA: molybdopterin cofactor-binding domain-containing protein, partial [Anaerolineaceae bacterium]